jgi:hypothetical protein
MVGRFSNWHTTSTKPQKPFHTTTVLQTTIMSTPVTITNSHGAIALIGDPKIAKRKTLVRIREVNGTEVFETKYGEGNLEAKQGIDFVVIPVDGAEQYPCKIDIFHKTWEETEKDSGIYRRKELCRCIPIPEGTTVILETLEGKRVVSHPNYIALGIEGEVYSYSPEWVEKNLEFVDT